MKPQDIEYEWSFSTGQLLAYSIVLMALVAVGIVAAVRWL